MTLFLALIVLPLILWRILLRSTVTRPYGLPLTAYVVATTVLIYGYMAQRSETWTVSQAAEGQTHLDTYYVVSHAQYFIHMGWIFAAIALLVSATQHLGRGRVIAVLPWLFFAFTFGTWIPRLLPSLLPMPLRYADYPDWFRVMDLTTSAAAILTFLAAAGLILTLLIAVIQSRRRSKS